MDAKSKNIPAYPCVARAVLQPPPYLLVCGTIFIGFSLALGSHDQFKACHRSTPTALKRRHAQTVGDRFSSYKIDYVIVITNFHNP